MKTIPRILFIDPLHERHGSTYRARNLGRLLSVNNAICYLEPSKGGGGHAGALGLLLSVFRCFRACLRNDLDILYLQKPVVITLLALVAARWKGKGVVIDFDDLDSLWQVSAWKMYLARVGERIMPKYADAVTTHNAYLKEHIARCCKTPLFLIPQGVDTKIFDPGMFDRTMEKKRLGIEGKQVFCFLGSFTSGSAADLDVILKAFKEVSDKAKDAFLLIVGGQGPLEQHYLGMIEDMGLRQYVLVTGRKDQRSIPRYLSCADYGLVFMRDNLANRCRVSLKLLEYLAMNLTVIGHMVGTSGDGLAPYCFTCEPTVESLSEKMLDVVRKGLKKEGVREFMVKNHDWNRFVPQVDAVVEYCELKVQERV